MMWVLSNGAFEILPFIILIAWVVIEHKDD